MVKNSSEYMKQYYQKNKDKYEYLKQRVTCEVCGKECRKGDLSRHRATKFHVKHLKESEENTKERILRQIQELQTKLEQL